MKLPLDNLSYPIKITIGNSTGSGFVIGHEGSSYLVTARHVLYQPESTTGGFVLIDESLQLSFYAFDKNALQISPTILQVDLKKMVANNNIKNNNLIDLVIIKLGTMDPLTFVDG